MSTPTFAYTSGNPDNLIGGRPAVMTDIQGPFYDLRAFLNNNVVNALNALSPPASLVTGARVLDVGVLNQIRAGRQLALADFTALGLTAPAGLWNLTDLTDASGNARALTNKGGVGFAPGINGVAGTSAQFTGSVGQALYIPDIGAADPFRIVTGSWGCWFKTAKRSLGGDQYLLTKLNSAASDRAYALAVNSANTISANAATATGAAWTALVGMTDVADDRWHFAVATFDGATLRVYLDGLLEGSTALSGALNGAAGPLNIGAYGADGGTAAASPHYGRVDEAFVSADVLSEDEIRLLYAAKIVHTLGTVPRSATLSVSRQRKGGALIVGNFPVQPLRLHNFTAGALTDLGSNGQVLVNNGAAVSVAGADGTRGGAFSFAGAQSLSATDAGLPAGLAARSYGCWFKTTASAAIGVIGWGTVTTGEAYFRIVTGTALSYSNTDQVNGPFVADGQWHHMVTVEDNAAADGVRRKLYVDGRLAGGSTVLNAIALLGANRFRIGARSDATEPFTGQVDGAFVSDVALAAADVAALYAVGSQPLGASPKNPGDHVERMDAAAVYLIADTLDSQHLIDLGVAA